MDIPIAKPLIGAEEKQAVLEVLESGALTQGKYVAAFEEAFASFHNASNAIAMNSGTSALVATLMAHGIAAGDEVIVPAFSFFATASSVLSVGARPIFADIDPSTFCLSPTDAEAMITPRTVAIMPVHLYGHPADMPSFQNLCERYGLLLLEDAAQAHGAAVAGKSVGAWGTAGFSFYATKNMMTIEGGMVLTADADLARKLRAIRNHGMTAPYVHELSGGNFRMSELSAALGLVQLKKLPGWTEQRRANAQYYSANLGSVAVPSESPGARHVYHQYTVRVPEKVDRDAVVQALNAQGIGARVYYPTPLYSQPVFQRAFRSMSLPESERAARQVVSLPVHPALTDQERTFIVSAVNAVCEWL
jgi:perosamine synthetase